MWLLIIQGNNAKSPVAVYWYFRIPEQSLIFKLLLIMLTKAHPVLKKLFVDQTANEFKQFQNLYLKHWSL